MRSFCVSIIRARRLDAWIADSYVDVCVCLLVRVHLPLHNRLWVYHILIEL